MALKIKSYLFDNTTVQKWVAYLFILLFVYAAASKLLDQETFTVQLAQSPLLSAYAGIIAWLVPGLEIGIAMLLTMPSYRKVGMYASFTLMVMFTTYIIIILNFSDFIPCSCGGVLEKLTWGQHLIFNGTFIILASISILFGKLNAIKKKLLLLILLAILASGVVTLLYAFSEKKMHRNNGFQRRYIPHPIKKIHSFNLKYSSYYFSGVGGGNIYLANTTAPLLMTVIDTSFQDTHSKIIKVDKMDLPYRSIQVRVIPPNFYVADGTVPIIFQGKINNWLAKTKMLGDYYFNQAYPIDSNKIAVKSSSSETGENIMGVIQLGDSVKGHFSNLLLEKQMDGIFDTDGQLIYNPTLKKIIYTYSYRNQYIIADNSLKLAFRGKTIDTVSKVQLQIIKNASKNLTKLGSKTVLINKNMATANNLLFVNSPRLGKHESEQMLEEAAIIDVYDLTDQSYRFSFYLYNHEKSKLREFMVSNDMLYALQGNYVVGFKLKNKIFN